MSYLITYGNRKNYSKKKYKFLKTKKQRDAFYNKINKIKNSFITIKELK